MSTRFAQAAREHGLPAHTLTLPEDPDDPDDPLRGPHTWAVVAGVNIDWTARQFHNLHHPPHPDHQDLPCPLIWVGPGHPVPDPAGAHPTAGAPPGP